MSRPDRIRVAVNGYGVIGKRMAEAIGQREDMATPRGGTEGQIGGLPLSNGNINSVS